MCDLTSIILIGCMGCFYDLLLLIIRTFKRHKFSCLSILKTDKISRVIQTDQFFSYTFPSGRVYQCFDYATFRDYNSLNSNGKIEDKFLNECIVLFIEKEIVTFISLFIWVRHKFYPFILLVNQLNIEFVFYDWNYHR